MKVKTSITISEELIRRVNALLGEYKNRSDFIEKAVSDYVEREYRRKRDTNDFEILNKKANKLNKEAEDVLSFQIKL